MKLPKIRENLLVQDLENEALIYDLTTNRSFCLNETAKTVFNACDGEKAIADVNLPEDVIYFSLDELKKQNLIESDYVSPFAGMNRREAIRKVGLASMVALPIVFGLAAPTAASAASACPAPNGSNIPSGCPVGTQISTGASSCAGTPDSDRTAVCNAFFRSQCQSGSARYSTGTCVNAGSGTLYSCACN